MAEFTTVFAPKGNRAQDASNTSRALVSFFFFHYYFHCFCTLFLCLSALLCTYMLLFSYLHLFIFFILFIPCFGSFFMLLYTFPVLICFFVHLYAFVFLLANKLKYCRGSKSVIKYYRASKCTVEHQKATLKHRKLRKSVKNSNQGK